MTAEGGFLNSKSGTKEVPISATREEEMLSIKTKNSRTSRHWVSDGFHLCFLLSFFREDTVLNTQGGISALIFIIIALEEDGIYYFLCGDFSSFKTSSLLRKWGLFSFGGMDLNRSIFIPTFSYRFDLRKKVEPRCKRKHLYKTRDQRRNWIWNQDVYFHLHSVVGWSTTLIEEPPSWYFDWDLWCHRFCNECSFELR